MAVKEVLQENIDLEHRVSQGAEILSKTIAPESEEEQKYNQGARALIGSEAVKLRPHPGVDFYLTAEPQFVAGAVKSLARDAQKKVVDAVIGDIKGTLEILAEKQLPSVLTLVAPSSGHDDTHKKHRKYFEMQERIYSTKGSDEPNIAEYLKPFDGTCPNYDAFIIRIATQKVKVKDKDGKDVEKIVATDFGKQLAADYVESHLRAVVENFVEGEGKDRKINYARLKEYHAENFGALKYETDEDKAKKHSIAYNLARISVKPTEPKAPDADEEAEVA